VCFASPVAALEPLSICKPLLALVASQFSFEGYAINSRRGKRESKRTKRENVELKKTQWALFYFTVVPKIF
jgi:hypothetical protein